MAWVKLDDGFFRHPKARAAGKNARELFISSCCWASANLSDGRVPKTVLKLLAAEAEVRGAPTARRLVEVGLWEEADDGWLIHDYLDFNPTAESALELRRKRAEAGRKGGLRSQHPSKPEASASASASANPQANGEANGKQIGSKIEPRTRTPMVKTNPSSDLRGGEHTSVGGGIIEEAVAMAARRYAETQVAQGKGQSIPGLTRWWLEQNADDARIRAKDLLAMKAPRLTQLADALLDPNAAWIRHLPPREPEPETT